MHIKIARRRLDPPHAGSELDGKIRELAQRRLPAGDEVDGRQRALARDQFAHDLQHAGDGVRQVGEIERAAGSIDPDRAAFGRSAREGRHHSVGMVQRVAVYVGEAHDRGAEARGAGSIRHVLSLDLGMGIDIARQQRRILGDRQALLLAIDLARAGLDEKGRRLHRAGERQHRAGAFDIDGPAQSGVALPIHHARHRGEIDDAIDARKYRAKCLGRPDVPGWIKLWIEDDWAGARRRQQRHEATTDQSRPAGNENPQPLHALRPSDILAQPHLGPPTWAPV